MKLKRLLKFYFNAEKLNIRLDRLLEHRASYARSYDALADLNGVVEIVGDKVALCRLYSYLKEIMDGLSDCDRAVLRRYSLLRVDIKRLDGGTYREYKRAAMKFSRRLRYIGVYAEETEVLKKYAVLI